MSFDVVSLVEGTEISAGDGVNGAIRALVRFDDNSIQRAIVKTLQPANLAAELFCAVLLRGWGLSVPDVAIVRGKPLRFASLDTGYPSLKQRIGWSENLPVDVKSLLEQHGSRLVSGFVDTPRALAADEAICNRDRNLGNILWDGTEASWIDHERVLNLYAIPDQNLLAIMATLSGNAERVQKAAVAIALSLGRHAVDAALNECADFEHANGFATIISNKLSPLANLVLMRFPQPKDLLTL